MEHKHTLREQYTTLDLHRSDVLDRAFTHASWTIPRMFLDRTFQGTQTSKDAPELYSSKPAQVIKKLASTFANTLFPSNDTSFFEFKFGPKATEEEKEALRDFVVQAEIATLDAIQASNYREKLYSSLEHAIVLPGSLMFQEKLGSFKVYHPSQFLIRRDGDGVIKEYWTLDWVVTELLDDDLKNINQGRPKHQQGEHEPLYTHCRLVDDKWTVDREFRDVKYEQGRTFDDLPFYFLGWTPVVGEDWSRSLVEDNFPTIRSLEMAAKALAEGLVAGSTGRANIDSRSSATIDDIGDTNWGLISIPAGSLEFIQPNVSQVLGVASAAIQSYSADLDEAFLTFSSADLRGERVTAFQTNAVANETQQARGGVLVTMEQNIEMMVRRTVGLLAKEGLLNPLFKDALDEGDLIISVASGLDAIGRQMDVLRLDALLERTSQDPDLRMWVKMEEVSRAYIRNTGLDPTVYTKSEEDVAAEQQATQQQQLQAQAGQQAIQTAGAVVEQNATL